MGSKILIGVGDCVDSKQAVKYAARTASAAKDVYFTLFHIKPLVPLIFREAAQTDLQVRVEVDALVLNDTETARCAAGELREVMVGEGVPDDRVEVVIKPMQAGMAKDILSRAEQGLYDAIVLGRRALTSSRDFFIGTTADKVVEHATEIPVWVVAGETISMNIMVCG